jgi:hypothetical protein
MEAPVVDCRWTSAGAFMPNKELGTIKVSQIVDNNDGTSTINFDVSEDFKKNLQESLGWTEWSDKKFNLLIDEAIKNYADTIWKEEGQTTEERK